MSGILIATLAGLLTPQTAPHPSTRELYTAPAIRPFEQGSDFGRETAEGDVAAPSNRAPLTAPITVDRYRGSYEVTPSDAEIAFDQGVNSAEIRTDQTAGPLDGSWTISDSAGRVLFDMVLMDPGSGTAEGGWRAGGRSGVATAENGVLTLEGGGSIALERTAAGWRGRMTREGRATAVTISRPD